MMKSTKKFIAIMLTLVFVLSMVLPMGVLAEEEANIGNKVIYFNDTTLADYGYSFNKTSNQGTVYNRKDYLYVRTQYPAYVKFVLDGYEEILSNKSTSLVLNFSPRNTSDKSIYDFRVYLANDDCDQFDFSKLNYTEAVKLNFHDDTRPMIYERTSTTAVSGVFSSGELDIKSFVDVLNEGYDNSSIALYLDAITGQSYMKPGSSNLTITYDKNEINNQEYVNSAAEKLTWDIISSDGADMVSHHLNLPKKFYGVDITWTSSDEDVVNSSSGEILTKSNTPVPVTLTANLKYTNALGENATLENPLTFTFNACLPVVSAEGYIPFTNGAVTRNDNDNSYGCMVPNNEDYANYKYLRMGGIFSSFAQLDFTGYEEILKNPGTTAVISFNSPYMGSSDNNYARDFNVYLSADSNDGYTGEELSYVDATNVYSLTDIDNRPILYSRSDAAYRGTFYEAVDVNTLAYVLDEGTDNSLVTMYFKSISGDTTYIRVNTEETGLYITYNKNEINNAEYLKEVKDALTWDVLSKGKQDKVSADLYLPTKFKGAKIVWELNDAAISSDGKVDFANNKGKTVKLTAKMTYTNILGQSAEAEKEFEVTISNDEHCVVRTPELKIEDNKFKASWGVENYTGADVTYYVYLAAYSDKELVELKPVEYIAKNGEPTFINPEVKFQEGYTAKLIVLKSDHITPLFAATEK